MTAPPPERPGDPERDARDVDASFAAIVSGWDGPAPAWPVEHSGPAAPAPGVTGPAEPAPEVEDDEGHYEPPEPPPVPRLHQATVGALALVALGALLLLAPGLIGFTTDAGFPLGLLSLTGGLAWLLLRLRSGPPPGSGWDNGARL